MNKKFAIFDGFIITLVIVILQISANAQHSKPFTIPSLALNLNARQAGMGDAFAGAAFDDHPLQSNVARLGLLRYFTLGGHFYPSRNDALPQGAIEIALPWQFGGTGLGITYIDHPEFDNRDNLMVSFGYGRETRLFNYPLASGIGLKYIRQAFLDTTSHGIGLDLGILYTTKYFSVGVSGRNFTIDKFELKHSEKLPGAIRGGIAFKLPIRDNLSWLLSADIEKIIDRKDFRKYFGTELQFSEALAIRSGYRNDNSHLSFGIGLTLPIYQAGLYSAAFDYAYTPIHEFDRFVHRFSLTIRFGARLQLASLQDNDLREMADFKKQLERNLAAAEQARLAAEESEKRTRALEDEIKARLSRLAEIAETSGGKIEIQETDEKAVEIRRYPTMEFKDVVAIEEEFPVLVSLRQDLITQKVHIEEGRITDIGELILSLPDQEKWEIDVILTAPDDFILTKTSNVMSIVLPKKGNSTTAIFYLQAKPIRDSRKEFKIYVTFVYKGGLLARIYREVTLTESLAKKSISIPETSQLNEANISSSRMNLISQGKEIILSNAFVPPDLTIEIIEDQNRVQINCYSIFLSYLKPIYDKKPVGLEDFLESYYQKFAQYSARNVTPIRNEQEAFTHKDKVLSLCRNFGRELYERYAPERFKTIFWELREKYGDRFQTIQIYSNNPIIPWELMRPYKGSKELDYLGIQFKVGTWHIDERIVFSERPPQTIPIVNRVLIAPRYEGFLDLPNQKRETESLKTREGFRQVLANYSDVKELFHSLPQGVIHFAGHGKVRPTRFNNYEYVIFLENDTLDVKTWKGFMPNQESKNHPLIFFNACEIGQSNKIANFVEGWAPAFLEAGASGYIGGLWPLGDKGAADFAIHFYANMERNLRTGPIKICDLLREARRQFYETGDPTYLAYMYFGDPNLQLMHY